MEYFIKELADKLMTQRFSLIEELCNLNENLPNYSQKVMELNNQIHSIDNNIVSFVQSVKDVKCVELQNDLAIKTKID